MLFLADDCVAHVPSQMCNAPVLKAALVHCFFQDILPTQCVVCSMLSCYVLGADHSGSELRNEDSKAENEPDTCNEPHEETVDGEDDIPEDEFVEWNEGKTLP